MTTPRLAPPILSRPLPVDDVPSGGLAVTVTPTADERAALARFNGLPGIASMTASLRLSGEPGGGIRVTGEVVAAVTQTCVVTLEPFDAEVREPVDVRFLPPDALAAFHAAHAGRAGADDENEDRDEPDLIEHGRIDVGTLAAEHLTLGLDPYPRKPGAELASLDTADEPPESPFAVLRARGENRS